jgi:hypothetical protein
MLLRLMSLIGLLFVIASSPSRAQSPGDVRCLILSNTFATQGSTEQSKEVARVASLFYAGRVSGLTDAQLRAAIVQQQRTLDTSLAGAEMKGCAHGMQTTLQRLKALGPVPQTK